MTTYRPSTTCIRISRTVCILVRNLEKRRCSALYHPLSTGHPPLYIHGCEAALYICISHACNILATLPTSFAALLWHVRCLSGSFSLCTKHMCSHVPFNCMLTGCIQRLHRPGSRARGRSHLRFKLANDTTLEPSYLPR